MTGRRGGRGRWAGSVSAILACGVLVAWARRGFLYSTVEGCSMEPTLYAGDRLLVRRVAAGRLRVGDLVVCPVRLPGGAVFLPPPGESDPRLWVKRLAALPGDPMPPGMVAAGYGGTVPPGVAVLLGDNPAASTDSRAVGPVPLDRVLGRVVWRPGLSREGSPAGW